MDALVANWNDLEEDHPVPLLHRRRVAGDKAMVARVVLEAGCTVAQHAHENEQIALIVSGKIKWFLGTPGTPSYEERVLTGGDTVVLRAMVPHGVEAIEETVILDVFCPPGPMGVDRQG